MIFSLLFDFHGLRSTDNAITDSITKLVPTTFLNYDTINIIYKYDSINI